MAKIIIHRKPAFNHRFRPFEVYIDGEKYGIIKNGYSEEFNVPEGHHKVQCKMSWYYSDAFDVKVKHDDLVYLQVKAGSGFLVLFYIVLILALLSPLLFSAASWYDENTFSLIRTAALVLIISHGLYHSFIARKHYLRISKDRNMFG